MADREEWDFGYYRRDSRGRKTYYVRGTWAGRRWEFSTQKHDETSATAIFREFQLDPHGFKIGGGVGEELLLTAALVAGYLEHLSQKGNEPQWIRDNRRYLKWWMVAFKGKNLKRAKLEEDILTPLMGTTAVKLKKQILKAFYNWLQETDRITAGQNPTLGRLKAGKVKAAQLTKKRAFSLEAHKAVRGALTARWQACVDVLAGTGWHVTELGRFAKLGRIDGDVLVTIHKSGEEHRTQVSPEVLGAAQRVLDAGPLSLAHFRRAVRDAANSVGQPVRVGSYRHAVAHGAIEAGATMQEVGTFLGHKDSRTTQKFYATLATPKKVTTLV